MITTMHMLSHVIFPLIHETSIIILIFRSDETNSWRRQDSLLQGWDVNEVWFQSIM